ncbi:MULTISPECIES: hypothetical protein [unclassified Microcoleus]
MTKNLTSAASIPELPVSESPETDRPLIPPKNGKLRITYSIFHLYVVHII